MKSKKWKTRSPLYHMFSFQHADHMDRCGLGEISRVLLCDQVQKCTYKHVFD